MAGIAQNIERYNSAYRLAWKHISELQKRVIKYSFTPSSLFPAPAHRSGNQSLWATDPFFIASEALTALDESEPGTH
jgi:hypothetical protein